MRARVEVGFGAQQEAVSTRFGAGASNYGGVPIGVISPPDAADVEAAMAVCREHDVPVHPVGSRTSIAGQAVNTAVGFDFRTHMNAIESIDPDARTGTVSPGRCATPSATPGSRTASRSGPTRRPTTAARSAA